jgi:hypothetical protein
MNENSSAIEVDSLLFGNILIDMGSGVALCRTKCFEIVVCEPKVPFN